MQKLTVDILKEVAKKLDAKPLVVEKRLYLTKEHANIIFKGDVYPNWVTIVDQKFNIL